MLLQYSICTVSSKMAFWSFAGYSRYCWRDQGFFSWAVQWWQSPESSRPSQTNRTLSWVLFVPTAINKMPCPTGSSYRFLFLDTNGSERASAPLIYLTQRAPANFTFCVLCISAQSASQFCLPLHPVWSHLVPDAYSSTLSEEIVVNQTCLLLKSFSPALHLDNDWFSSVRHLGNIIFKATTQSFWSIFWVLLTSIGQIRS